MDLFKIVQLVIEIDVVFIIYEKQIIRDVEYTENRKDKEDHSVFTEEEIGLLFFRRFWSFGV